MESDCSARVLEIASELIENTPVNEIQITRIEDDINTVEDDNHTESKKECSEETGNCHEECMPVESIYTEDGGKKEKALSIKPRQRPTKVQLATMDTLALFNGSDLGSVIFKRKDLKDKLEMEAEKLKSQTEKDATIERPRTRLQAAKLETNAIFKHIPLGERIGKSATTRRKPMRFEKDGHKVKRLSKLDRAKAEALKAFGGAPLESLSKRQKKDLDDTQVLNPQPDPCCTSINRLSRVERARVEAIKSFGGSGLGEVLGKAKKHVARTLEIKKESCKTDDIRKNEEKNARCDKENLIN